MSGKKLSPMVRLSDDQMAQKMTFIEEYIDAENAASGSSLDANANVSHKNIATLSAEIHKDINIQLNRTLLKNKINEMYGQELADEYIRQLESHEIYCHDETSLYPYCVSISMYPFLLNGMTQLGGESKAPKHLDSFCGSFINLIFAVASQFAGAVATVEFLMCFDYFARKDYGDDYLNTHSRKVESALQHVVYSLNQPAAARGFQSVFWNISLFDREYFEAIFGDFAFPITFEKPNYDSLAKLQKHFMKWFNAEREKTLLTFPVITAAQLVNDKEDVSNGLSEFKDPDFADFIAEELAEGNSFFIYQSDNADSLASCCRMKNEIQDKPTFSYSLGAGGVATGSINVMTININRLIQDKRDLAEQVKKIHLYQTAYRKNVEYYKSCGILPVYDADFITLEKQFLTIGLIGIAEAAEYCDITPGNNKEYKEFVGNILKVVYDLNRQYQEETGYMVNTELVPGESLGVKFAKWDKDMGYFSPRDCYNSYFYIVEDESIDIVDKFVLHGQEIVQYLDGGSALHLNMLEHPTKDGYLNLLKLSAQVGCNYWTTNVLSTCCEEPGCKHINKKFTDSCIKCGSTNVSHATRVIGYLKKVESYSKERKDEHVRRHYHK